MVKKRRIVLEPSGDDKFVVVRLVNTVRYGIGDIVSRREAEDLIRAPHFEVVMQPAKLPSH